MQFCLKESVQMKPIVRKSRLLPFRAAICFQMSAFFQTPKGAVDFGALLILLLNALQTLENHQVSCVFSPVKKQNPLAQNG